MVFKKWHLIIAVIFLTGTIFYLFEIESKSGPILVASTKKTRFIKPIRTSLQFDQLVHATLVAKKTTPIFFERNGQLKKGEVSFRDGQYVNKNQVIVQLNFEEEYTALVDLKKRLRQETLLFLDRNTVQFDKTFKEKWNSFASVVDPTRRLPNFPLIDSEAEKQALRLTDIGRFYVQANALERKIEESLYLASTNGWLINCSKKIGDQLNERESIAQFVNADGWELSLASAELHSNVFGEFEVVNDKKRTIGTCNIQNKSDQMSVTIRLRPRSIRFPATVWIKKTQIEQVYRIPISVIKNNRVLQKDGKKTKWQKVDILKSTVDSAYVKGLQSDRVLMVLKNDRQD